MLCEQLIFLSTDSLVDLIMKGGDWLTRLVSKAPVEKSDKILKNN